MKVGALSFAGFKATSIAQYRAELEALLRPAALRLAVLPAYSALWIGLQTGALQCGPNLAATIRLNGAALERWNAELMALHSELALQLNLYLAMGTAFSIKADQITHYSCCIDPAGQICGRQTQTHLAKWEREAGLIRGEELPLFQLDHYKVALIIGTDARHPEVGRILALQGADLVIASGALPLAPNCWSQVAGLWAQVQQNQFWAVEAQLCATVAGTRYGAASAIIAPCELTADQSGYLQRSYPDQSYVSAWLDGPERSRLQQSYPLLKLLNPAAYQTLYPHQRTGRDH